MPMSWPTSSEVVAAVVVVVAEVEVVAVAEVSFVVPEVVAEAAAA